MGRLPGYVLCPSVAFGGINIFSCDFTMLWVGGGGGGEWPIFIWPQLSGESVCSWVSSTLDVMKVEGVFQQSDLPPRQARGRGRAR